MQNRDGLGIQILANGVVLPEHIRDGKTYVAAPWNTDYRLNILVPAISGYRHPYKRFLAVLSVDGLDVMTGKTASASATSGYIMTPRSRSAIPGFRLNDQEVAGYRFGDRTDSYAAMLDKPQSIGVIGVVFYSERNPRPEPRYRTCSPSYDLEGTLGGGGATRGGGGATRGGGGVTRGGGGVTRGGGGVTRGGHDMGTEFGRGQDHVVSRDSFDTEREVARFVLEYASYESLKLAGIINESPLGSVNAFPADTGCTPPKGWRG